jgi:hypothetical protein
VEAALPIRNTNRVVGTIVGSEITRRGAERAPDDTIRLNFAPGGAELRRILFRADDVDPRGRRQRLPGGRASRAERSSCSHPAAPRSRRRKTSSSERRVLRRDGRRRLHSRNGR